MQNTFDYFDNLKTYLRNSAQIKIRYWWFRYKLNLEKAKEMELKNKNNKKKKGGKLMGKNASMKKVKRNTITSINVPSLKR